MSVDNHNLTIIATDGENVEPIEAESLISLAGERFDFVLDANQEVKNYWIRFKGIQDCGPKQAYQVAILNYLGANEDQDPEGVVTYETAGRSGVVSSTFYLIDPNRLMEAILHHKALFFTASK